MLKLYFPSFINGVVPKQTLASAPNNMWQYPETFSVATTQGGGQEMGYRYLMYHVEMLLSILRYT